MKDLLSQIAKEMQPSAAIEFGRLKMVELGAIGGTFHIAAPHSSQVGPRVFISEFGHDEAWVQAYFDPDIRKHDPVPDYMMRRGEAMILDTIVEHLAPTPDQIGWLERFYPMDWHNVVAIPAYGPFDFDTFVTIIMPNAFGAPTDLLVREMVAIVEVVNRRVAQLVEGGSARAIKLSDREEEVLNWIGRSKSNTDIATILDLSAATVDTYIRRLFAKLEVNDRISATLKGVRLGFVRF